jgi:ribosomal protein L24
MAFKVGEYVTSKERPYLGKGRITDEVDFNQYIVKFGSGAQDLFEGSDLVAANGCAKNAKFKVNDAVTVWRGKYKGREGRILGIYPTGTGKQLVDMLGHEGRTVVDIEDLSKGFKDGTNSCAKNGKLRSAEDKLGNKIVVGDMVKLDGGKKGKVVSIEEYEGEGPYITIEGSFRPVKSYLFATKISNSSCGIRSTNAAVNAALNGCNKATNGWNTTKMADGSYQKSFSMDLGAARMYYVPDGPTQLEIEAWDGPDFKHFGRAKDVVAKVKAEMRPVKKTMDALEKIIAWVEQNAK